MVIKNYRHYLTFITVLTCLILFFSCTGEKTDKEGNNQKEKVKIKLGLIPEQNIFDQLQRFNGMASYLKSKVNIEVEFKILTRYGNIVSNFNELELDGAFFGSFVYTIARARLGVTPLVRPVNKNGSSTYHGLIFIRNDSGLNSIEDMRGKTFAFVDKATTAGYLLPLYFFKNNGIDNYGLFFKKAYFTGTHEDAIYDVLNKDADVGAAKNTVFYRLAESDPRLTNELKIITRSPDVPENGLAVRQDIDEKIKNRIKKTLLDMHLDPEGKKALEILSAIMFIETTDSDYGPVYKYSNEIGLDLGNYDYINE